MEITSTPDAVETSDLALLRPPELVFFIYPLEIAARQPIAAKWLNACSDRSSVKITYVMSLERLCQLSLRTRRFLLSSEHIWVAAQAGASCVAILKMANKLFFSFADLCISWATLSNLTGPKQSLWFSPDLFLLQFSPSNLIAPSSTWSLEPSTSDSPSVLFLSSAFASNPSGSLVKSYCSCPEDDYSAQLLLPPQSKPPPSLSRAVETAS